jgi:hypothetical protein
LDASAVFGALFADAFGAFAVALAVVRGKSLAAVTARHARRAVRRMTALRPA